MGSKHLLHREQSLLCVLLWHRGQLQVEQRFRIPNQDVDDR